MDYSEGDIVKFIDRTKDKDSPFGNEVFGKIVSYNENKKEYKVSVRYKFGPTKIQIVNETDIIWKVD